MNIRKSTWSFQLFAAVLVLSLTAICSAKPIYVASDGNDAHAGDTPDQPVRTVARALDLAQPDDEVLLKRGGEYDAISLGNVRDLTFRAYGEGAPPLIRGEKAIHGSVKRTITNVTFEDLHLRGTGHGNGVSWFAKTDGLTFRGCRIENYRTNLVIQGADDRPIKNVTLEDCLVLDAHDPEGSGHSHGIFANFVENLVVRRCLFDNNGRRHDNQGTIFNHALYINVGGGPIVFEDNVSTRNFADGGQFRTGGVIRRNVFALNPIATDIGAVRGGSSPIANGIDLVFDDNILAYPGDISDSHPRGIGLLAGNYRKLAMHRNHFLFYKGGKHGRNVAIKYDDVSDVKITDYAASENWVQGFPRLVTDATNQGHDFALTPITSIEVRDLTPWITEARRSWGAGPSTAAGLRALILGDAPPAPTAATRVTLFDAPDTYELGSNAEIRFALDGPLNDGDVLVLAWHDDQREMIPTFAHSITAEPFVVSPTHLANLPPGRIQLQLALRHKAEGKLTIVSRTTHWLEITGTPKTDPTPNPTGNPAAPEITELKSAIDALTIRLNELRAHQEAQQTATEALRARLEAIGKAAAGE